MLAAHSAPFTLCAGPRAGPWLVRGRRAAGGTRPLRHGRPPAWAWANSGPPSGLPRHPPQRPASQCCASCASAIERAGTATPTAAGGSNCRALHELAARLQQATSRGRAGQGDLASFVLEAAGTAFGGGALPPGCPPSDRWCCTTTAEARGLRDATRRLAACRPAGGPARTPCAGTSSPLPAKSYIPPLRRCAAVAPSVAPSSLASGARSGACSKAEVCSEPPPAGPAPTTTAASPAVGREGCGAPCLLPARSG